MSRRARESGFPWRALEQPLMPADRASLARSLRGLLRWQRSLRGWPAAITGAPDATPFVSLYSRGKLCGCFGSAEGGPGERIARAFLRALEDARHGGVHAPDRATLVAQVSYARRVQRVASPDEAVAQIAPGTHGIAFVRDDGAATLHVPSVARDGGLMGRALLDALARKARASAADLARGALFLFETEDVVARLDASGRPTRRSPAALAAEWLSRLVGEDGFVHFGVDPRARQVEKIGLMHHGRAAVVLRALREHGGFDGDVERATDWLEREVKAGLRGRRVEGWPESRERVAGTVALTSLAGVPLAGELEAFVGSDPMAASPWHAAQVVAALGASAPAALWGTCVSSLRVKPWAPWTVIAAHARADAEPLARPATALEASVRSVPPHEGSLVSSGGSLSGTGLATGELPELAITALTVEALAPLGRASATAAIVRARAFLSRWQRLPGALPASLDPDLAVGSFPLSPVHPFARGDVTAHALLALRA